MLYRDVQPRLLRYLRARAGQDAEDVASAAWLDAARNLRGFAGGEDDFRAWMFTIARRRLADHRRRESRRPAEPVPDSALADRVVAADAETEALAGRLGDDAARRVVAVLPPEQAEIVLLRVVAGLSVERVAEVTGRRPGSVRVLQHRALRKLAKEIPDEV